MEAVCRQPAAVPVIYCTSAGSRPLNLVETTSLECSLGGGLVRQPLTCKPSTFSSKGYSRTKPGGQLWRFDSRSEATAGFEDSISDKKKNADVVVRKGRDVIATGGHRGNLNAFSVIKDADCGETAHLDAATGVGKETCQVLNGDASCGVDNGVLRNGSVNGNTVKKVARNGSANGNAYNGIPPLYGSANGASGIGASMCADKESVADFRSMDGIYRNSRVVDGASVNTAVNGYSMAPPADGASSMVPKLERLVPAPLNVPSKQSEGFDSLMELTHQLEDPTAFTTTLTRTLRPQSTTAVIDDVDVWDVGRQQSSVADTSSGLGIIKFLKGKNLLVTGATGFLAKGTY